MSLYHHTIISYINTSSYQHINIPGYHYVIISLCNHGNQNRSQGQGQGQGQDQGQGTSQGQSQA